MAVSACSGHISVSGAKKAQAADRRRGDQSAVRGIADETEQSIMLILPVKMIS
jgi:hypothetical protein